MSQFTEAQAAAIAASGNILVMAGAGTGKTRTLVERCLKLLLDPAERLSLDEILLVTFTEAASAEMRQRLRLSLESEARKLPDDPRLAEHLALLDGAMISTLHSFCYRLVRNHFYTLGLDPQVKVLEQSQASILAAQTLQTLMEEHYSGDGPFAQAVQALIAERARGRDESIRKLVMQLYYYAQSLPNPIVWLANRIGEFENADPSLWRQWLELAFQEWHLKWHSLCADPDFADVENIRLCRDALGGLSPNTTFLEGKSALEAVIQADQMDWKRGSKKKVRTPFFKEFFEEAAFLHSFVPGLRPADPLAEDWEWTRHHVRALLQLTDEFSRRFAEAKRSMAAVDFQDLEQLALRLLLDAQGQPTPLALDWQRKLRHVFVDEYQDINAAQDAILTALGRPGTDGNRFLVGDVKQSIYRFRRANPRIFQTIANEWQRPSSHGQRISLSENFRSHEAILNFINPLFATLMQAEFGGVEYDEEARLKFGGREQRTAMAAAAGETPRVELHFIVKGSEKDDEGADFGDDGGHSSTEGAEVSGLENAEREARLIALRLREIKESGHPVWDNPLHAHRPVEWRDMVVLLRAPRGKAEQFAQEFARLGVPFHTRRGGFFDAIETLDLVNILRLLDNPLQDWPLMGVLRSPLVGMSPNEMAVVRLSGRKKLYWTALQSFHDHQADFLDQVEKDSTIAPENRPVVLAAAASAWPKVDAFFQRHKRWRELARQGALSHCLESILDETFYEAWCKAQERGQQRCANIQKLLALTRRFDPLQRQGLFRFLKYVEAQAEEEIETEPAAVDTENAVRLMSVHQSKGLEFPIVVAADLGKVFNTQDSKGEILFDEDYGVCPRIKPPGMEQRYPSLSFWLAKRRQKRESIGEEIRLLYVALTRACDRLILTGSLPRTDTEGEQAGWTKQALSANSVVKWLIPWLPEATGDDDWLSVPSGVGPLCSWDLYLENDERFKPVPAARENGEQQANHVNLTGEDLRKLEERMAWSYPFGAATREPAKTSVSLLRKRLLPGDEDEGRQWLAEPGSGPAFQLKPRKTTDGLSSSERGNAHHIFLELLRLQEVSNKGELLMQAQRMVQEQWLTQAEADALDIAAIAGFWASATGLKIRTQAGCVQRELPFTLRLDSADLAGFNLLEEAAALDGEFIVVQGVVDLAVILPKEIWLLDFKTDHFEPARMEEKVQLYTPQLSLYSLALSRIYNRPVSQCWLHFLAPRKTVAIPQG